VRSVHPCRKAADSALRRHCSCCCALPCCRGVPPPRVLHLASAPSADGGRSTPAAADGGGGGVGGLAARAKAALPCRKHSKCEWWARVGSAASADKYGAQYFALCIAIKVRRSSNTADVPLS
jgi:hypothetical protein